MIRLRRIALQLALSATAFVISLVAVEVSLRAFVDRLPLGLANEITSGYSARPSGIYRYRGDMKMLVMRPNYEREIFFNGYHWHHRTDATGFRNPGDRASADVVLLGDSMVYGHGLEESATIRHRLEAIVGRPVANLGMPGAGIHQEYEILERFGLALRPRYVFLFFLFNDLTDLTITLQDDEMRRFLATAVADHETPWHDVVPSQRRRPRLKDYWNDLYTVRAWRFFRRIVGLGQARAGEPSGRDWESRSPFRSNPRLALAMRFHLYALLKMQDLGERNHFEFVNVLIWTGRFPDEEPVYVEVLESFCREHGIAFYNLREAERVLDGDSSALFLPGDGHFSALGARWVAMLLASRICEGHVVPPTRIEAVDREVAGPCAR
jgi:hypothetical protein